MPLQNRVDPWGRLVTSHGRDATLLGNRGIVHDDEQQVVRAQGSRTWIACALSFKGRRLPLMEPGRNTQLFFLDEATALAAGHRPCFECRRADATRFLHLHRRVTGAPGARVGDLDAALSAERRVPRSGVGDGKRAYRAEVGSLPDGTMVEVDGAAWLLLDRQRVRWTVAGYDPASRTAVASAEQGWVLTPPTTIALLQAGYRPALHPSALS